jgi:probable addiction module antidote protein
LRLTVLFRRIEPKEMTEKLTTYDPAEDLTTEEGIADFMAAAFETNDAAYIAHALSIVARAKDMTRRARAAACSAAGEG